MSRGPLTRGRAGGSYYLSQARSQIFESVISQQILSPSFFRRSRYFHFTRPKRRPPLPKPPSRSPRTRCARLSLNIQWRWDCRKESVSGELPKRVGCDWSQNHGTFFCALLTKVVFAVQNGFIHDLASHCGLAGLVVWDPTYVVVSDTTQGDRHSFSLNYVDVFLQHTTRNLVHLRWQTSSKGRSKSEGNQLVREAEAGPLRPQGRATAASCRSQVVDLKLIPGRGRSVLVPPHGSSRRQRRVRPPSNRRVSHPS